MVFKVLPEGALVAEYNKQIRPILNVIDSLRSLGISSEGVKLPTIVVVGDQSHGKSSVLESLAGIDLPRGTGVVTRVPLILRLQRADKESILLEHECQKAESVARERVAEAVLRATDILAGKNKGVTNKPITLTVSRPDLPDLTLVDLPGIVRVAIGDQPKNIHEQISTMIRNYIESDESIILNVLSAQVDFATCESIVMSAIADKTGSRTLAVVTKSDKAADGLFEKVTENAVPIGLGYVLVCNRTNDSMSHEEARKVEHELFTNHSQLKRLPLSQLGIPALSARLTSILATQVSVAIPKIKADIEAKLNARETKLAALPRGWDEAGGALGEFINVTDKRKQSEKLLMQGENEEFPDDLKMHYAPRLHQIFKEFGQEIRDAASPFLSTEYSKTCALAMEEAKGVTLSNVTSPRVLHHLVKEEVVKIFEICTRVADTACDYAVEVSSAVEQAKCSSYPNLASAFRQITVSVMENAQRDCKEYIVRRMEKEAKFVFTDNHYYMDVVTQVRAKIQERKDVVRNCRAQGRAPPALSGELEIEVNGPVSNDDQAVLDVQVNMYAYWKVVQKRVIDDIPLEIRYRLEAALLEEVDEAVRAQVCSKVEEYMKEKPEMQNERVHLQESIRKLRDGLNIIKALPPFF